MSPLLTVHHELFQSFFTPEATSPRYFNLWSEGLAALASYRLQPGASLGAVLSSDTLAREAPPLLTRQAHAERRDIPRRSASYVGYRIAAELAHLEGPRLLAEIERTLLALETESE